MRRFFFFSKSFFPIIFFILQFLSCYFLYLSSKIIKPELPIEPVRILRQKSVGQIGNELMRK